MGGVGKGSGSQSRPLRDTVSDDCLLTQGATIDWHPPETRDEEVARLNSPWVADEGPLTADFRRCGEGVPELDVTGLAFDDTTTVWWDEDAVQVIRVAAPDDNIVAVVNPVMVREGFNVEGLQRIDYVQVGGRRGGVLLASRYVVDSTEAVAQNASEETHDA